VLCHLLNCVAPHTARALFRDDCGSVLASRLHGVRVNASIRVHADLDDAAQLDRGHPRALAAAAALVVQRHLCVVGGCCGTDYRFSRSLARELRR
jgi:S-methylmethionine-dependent homocysteine/selenocysteine methylase